jgi:hypothetical protein
MREEFLLPDPIRDASIATDHPLYVRIRAPWALLEPEPGDYDWSELDRIVDPYRQAGYAIILCLAGTNPAYDVGGAPTQQNQPALKGWLEFIRATALRYRGRVATYEVGDRPNREPGWAGSGATSYAYVLKQSSVTVRSADPVALIAQGSLVVARDGREDLEWQRAVFEAGTPLYVDALPLQLDVVQDFAALVARVYDLILEHDPSGQVWITGTPISGSDERERAADLVRRFLEGHGEGASLITFDLEADVEGLPEFAPVLLDLHKLFLPTFVRTPGARVVFETGLYGTTLHGIVAYHFFDATSYQGLVGFYSADQQTSGRGDLVLETAAVQGVGIYDLIGGAAGPVRDTRSDYRTNRTRVPVPVTRRPMVLAYSRVLVKGFETEKERLAVRETGLITAEEVIAAHQAFMTDQRFRLKTILADALLSYHAKIAGSNTVDISIDNAFFFDRETGAEWEQRSLYYNGVRWKGKKLPELPIPQPEKVFTLPLDINLNRDYVYEYEGRETVDGYDCHVVRFRPVDPTRTLYEGRAWIESRTFAPVKTSTVHTRVLAPIVSNEETNHFAPQAGPDGSTYWILTRVEGQQVFAVAGQNLVLIREIDFSRFRINDPEFTVERDRAYASDRQMLRDTESGLQYLDRAEDGGRAVRTSGKDAVLLGLAGLYRQPGLDYAVLPLVGAAYFDFTLRQREVQFTALLGGLVNLVSFSDPKLFGRRMDGTAQYSGVLVDVTDRLYVGADERETSAVDTRRQFLTLGLGVPLGNFNRLRLTYDLEYANFSLDEDTDTFVVPADTFVQTPGFGWEFNRAGWTVSADLERGYRDRWDPWGDTSPPSPEVAAQYGSPCDSPGSCLAEFDPAQDVFDRWEFAVAKQVFLRRFQKLRFEARWQAGSGFDRFSEHQFSFFGNRLRGFSGSGVRYDRGGLARAQYAFNIADVVRFEASLDYGRVRDVLVSDDYRSFAGAGVSGNLMGPWETVLQFDIGIALHSDIEDLAGGTEFQIGLLKYF